MSFADNLQYLRKKKEMTQEQLAETLMVSRQSVSKWESENSFPEMEKLLQICQIFGCKMDDLLQGDVRETFREDSCRYDAHKNRRAKRITIGVCLVLTGLFLTTIQDVAGMENPTAIPFLLCLIVSVILFVIEGMEDEYFRKKNPEIEDFYTQDDKDDFHHRFTIMTAVGVGLCIAGMILGVALNEIGNGREEYAGVIFLFLVTIAVGLFVYGGLMKEKYDIDGYNRKNDKIRSEKNSIVCGCIFLLATIAFLLTGLLGKRWDLAWIAYLTGIILCGIATLIIQRETRPKS